MAAVELPDVGYVTLCHVGGADFLCHRVTRERVALPVVAPPLSWQLGFDADGWSFVEAGDDRRWGSSLFTARAVRVGGSIGILVGQEALHLSDYLNENRMKLLPIHVGSASVVLKVWVFVRQQIGGCKWWWGLSTIWQSLQPSTQRPGEWVANWWRHWVKRFAKFKIGSPHLRPSVRMQKTMKFDLAIELDTNERVLPEASVSTPTLLVLLARLSTGNRAGREKRQGELERWVAFLDALLKQCLPLDFDVSFWLEPHLPMLVDAPPTGNHRIKDEVRNGKVLPPSEVVDGCHCTFPAAFIKVFSEGAVPVSSFLRGLETQGVSSLFGIFWQVATGVAAVLEARLTADEHPERTALTVMAPQAASKRQKTHLSRLAKVALAVGSRRVGPSRGETLLGGRFMPGCSADMVGAIWHLCGACGDCICCSGMPLGNGRGSRCMARIVRPSRREACVPIGLCQAVSLCSGSVGSPRCSGHSHVEVMAPKSTSPATIAIYFRSSRRISHLLSIGQRTECWT